MRPFDGVLFGAGLGWLEGLIPFLFVLIWLVSNVVGAIRKVAKPAGRLPQVRPQPVAGRPVGIDREIEELLRRTLRGESVPPPPPPVKRLAKQQRSQKSKKTKTPASVPSRVSGGSSGSDVARHVQEAFSHDLAHQSPSGTALHTGAGRAASLPIDLIAALRSPEDLRQLVIAREILDVPSHRW
jgi:hypothetical protein